MSTEFQIAEPLVKAPRYGALRVAIGRALYWRHRLRRKSSPDELVLEQVGGLPLLVAPGVLNPRLMRTGEFFASQLRSDLIGSQAEVLDMGTGSGVCALFAAQHAQHVVAVDINPAAVRCARVNALINRLEHRIEVLHGDLFAPVTGRCFDIVLFNPPFLRGVPRDDADRAWRSTDVAERFAARLRAHLRPSGFALVLLSTYGDAWQFVHQFSRHGFTMEAISERSFINEKLTILRLT